MLRRGSVTQEVVACHELEEDLTWKPVATEIYSRIPFIWMRCLFFLGSMVLYSTDIVRSGLGLANLTVFGKPQVGIESFSFFGPYAYPLQTIRKEDHDNRSLVFYGFAENDRGGIDSNVTQVPIWPYKLDTLSVVLRSLAIQLGVQEYPECLLTTRAQCPYAALSLETVFSMLDALIDGIQYRLDHNTEQSVAFSVAHQHVDTLEQTLYAFIRVIPEIRFYTLHSFRENATHGQTPVPLLSICQRYDYGFDPPSFCTTVGWPTELSIPNATKAMRAEEHIAMRFARFQAENPDLDFDLVILTARTIEWVENSAAVYYTNDNEEVTTLIRGRKCDAKHVNCETLLVDDFRYERIVLQTNVEEVYGLVAFLRGTAQVYVWLRLMMLGMGVVVSTWYEHESASMLTILFRSSVNLLKVPNHVVVYGTMVPVVLYASAHMIDCSLYHVIVHNALVTLMGTNALLDVRNDVPYITLKMRNIWFIAVLCMVIVYYKTHWHHHEEWKHRFGIVGFRGSMMGLLSFLALFFPIRLASFRQIDILSFKWHDVKWDVDPIWPLLRLEYTPASTGPFLEIRCFVLAVIAFVAFGIVVKVLLWVTRRQVPLVMAHSTVIPYSAGTLWSTLALTGYWITSIDRHPRHLPRPSVSPTFHDSASQLPVQSPCQAQVHSQTQPSRGHLIVHSTPSHIRALRVETRTAEMWALVRLMNIVMMTNPWVYVRLRYIGVALFVYRLKGDSGCSTTINSVKGPSFPPDPLQAFVLPDRIERLYEVNQLEFEAHFELLGVVNSTNLSWNQLIMCG